MDAREMAGGCQCGRVRYVARVDGDDAYLCHCRLCQRATGGFAAAFVELPVAAVAWVAAPDWYASSPVARRPFCAVCGTPLGFAWADGKGNVDLTVGSFDDPAGFMPRKHVGVESMHSAWLDLVGLPREASADNPNVARRWQAAGRGVPA